MDPAVTDTPASATRAGGRRVLMILVVLTAAGAGIALGWLANAAWGDATGLRLTGAVSGTITVVNATGEAICLRADPGGEQRCGVAYEPRDEPALGVGQQVTAATGWVRTARGTEEEVFVIVARQ